MRKSLLTSLLILFIAATVFGQSAPPKREYRSAWIASVTNLDWPTNPNLTIEQQKSSLISLLDLMKSMNMNVVIFQVRPECDALYKSNYEPWSYYLTGAQGLAPSSNDWDPLEFAIQESHKRGMELHAWVNPYRAVKTIGQYPISPNHISVTHPDWILSFSSIKILNPGLPAVREYNVKIFMDIVRRYDVDGLHMDDYFYPYPPDQVSNTNPDLSTFQQYPNGFTNINDWRRDNVNKLMKMTMDSINAVKPWVKFGLSPFGIWKNGVPAGIVGMDAYSVIYADPIAWLREGSIDYLTPQLYWKIGGSQDYSKLMPWWADSTAKYNRHFVPGHIFNANYTNQELPNQVKLNRNNAKCRGSVFFRVSNFVGNDKGFRDTLKNNYYKYKSFVPVMSWKDIVQPNQPRNLRFDRIGNSPIAALTWDVPLTASDGDSARFYAIYQFDNGLINQADLTDAKAILDIVGSRVVNPVPMASATGQYYFVVTSLDKNNNESNMSNIIQVEAPQAPVLKYPENNAVNQPDNLVLRWNYSNPASAYRLQISKDPNFATVLIDKTNLTDTAFAIPALEGQQTFYWRVKAANIAGESNFSDAKSFTTGYPIAPVLLYPTNNTSNIPIQFDFLWNKTTNTDSYRLQLSYSSTFVSSSIIIDTVGLTDTVFVSPQLQPNRFHFFRVASKNQYGYSVWSAPHAFKTIIIDVETENNEIPTEYKLQQNFPNPFNPTTTISFSLPKAGYVNLSVYNILGQEVANLIDEDLSAGNHRITFDASQLTSGIYVYSLKSQGKVLSKKMVLIK
jgi:uncharacterized lipoprotein YddW (UPF0748 family)